MNETKKKKQNYSGGRETFDIRFRIKGENEERNHKKAPDWMNRFLDIHNEMGNLEEYSAEKVGTHA